MAKPTNRSPWIVKLKDHEAKSFRLESKAREHLASLGFPNSSDAPKGALKRHLKPKYSGLPPVPE